MNHITTFESSEAYQYTKTFCHRFTKTSSTNPKFCLIGVPRYAASQGCHQLLVNLRRNIWACASTLFPQSLFYKVDIFFPRNPYPFLAKTMTHSTVSITLKNYTLSLNLVTRLQEFATRNGIHYLGFICCRFHDDTAPVLTEIINNKYHLECVAFMYCILPKTLIAPTTKCPQKLVVNTSCCPENGHNVRINTYHLDECYALTVDKFPTSKLNIRCYEFVKRFTMSDFLAHFAQVRHLKFKSNLILDLEAETEQSRFFRLLRGLQTLDMGCFMSPKLASALVSEGYIVVKPVPEIYTSFYGSHATWYKVQTLPVRTCLTLVNIATEIYCRYHSAYPIDLLPEAVQRMIEFRYRYLT